MNRENLTSEEYEEYESLREKVAELEKPLNKKNLICTITCTLIFFGGWVVSGSPVILFPSPNFMLLAAIFILHQQITRRHKSKFRRQNIIVLRRLKFLRKKMMGEFVYE